MRLLTLPARLHHSANGPSYSNTVIGSVVDHHYGLFPFSRVCAYLLAYLLSEAYLAWKIPAIGVEPFQHPL